MRYEACFYRLHTAIKRKKMKIQVKNISSMAMVLVLALFLSACGNKKAAESTAAVATETKPKEDENNVEISPEQFKSAGIILGSPEMKSMSGVLKVNGFIDVPPQNLVSITTQMGGIVRSSPLLPGTSVRKGQLVAILENQEYVQLQQDYLESKSQLELTDSEYRRQQTLALQNVNAQKVLQQAKSQYQVALARENALKQRLRLININPANLTAGSIRSQVSIFSPINGYVTKVNVNTGKFVNPNDVMFEIVDNSNLHVELNVFEKDAAKIRKGQKVRFTLTNDDTERTAVVQLVGGEINTDKTVTVHAIAKGSNGFIPGTYLKAFIETGSNEVVALPENGVVDFQGKKYIFIAVSAPKESTAQGGNGARHYKMIPVEVGVSDAGYVAVNIPADTDTQGKVVLKGAYDLLSKMKNSEEE
jgi:cobalt-zinc-cadmium efflux system membrane fusion protein